MSSRIPGNNGSGQPLSSPEAERRARRARSPGVLNPMGSRRRIEALEPLSETPLRRSDSRMQVSPPDRSASPRMSSHAPDSVSSDPISAQSCSHSERSAELDVEFPIHNTPPSTPNSLSSSAMRSQSSDTTPPEIQIFSLEGLVNADSRCQRLSELVSQTWEKIKAFNVLGGEANTLFANNPPPINNARVRSELITMAEQVYTKFQEVSEHIQHCIHEIARLPDDLKSYHTQLKDDLVAINHTFSISAEGAHTAVTELRAQITPEVTTPTTVSSTPPEPTDN